jgi:hypothetical protein
MGFDATTNPKFHYRFQILNRCRTPLFSLLALHPPLATHHLSAVARQWYRSRIDLVKQPEWTLAHSMNILAKIANIVFSVFIAKRARDDCVMALCRLCYGMVGKPWVSTQV